MSTISQDKKTNRGNTRQDKNRLFVKIVVWVLIAAMLGGTFYYFIYFLLSG